MPKSVQQARVAVWAATLSLNKEDRTPEGITKFKDAWRQLYAHLQMHCTKFIFQLECTELDNWHYQIYFRCEKTRRPAYEVEGMEDTMNLSPASTDGIHSLSKYAMKRTSRQAGPWNDRDEQKIEQMELNDLIIANTPPWRPWQADAYQHIISYKSDRLIPWYVDKEGKAGKTVLAKYIAAKHDAVFFTYGDARSILSVAGNWLSKNPCRYHGHRIIMFNFTKSKPKDAAWEDIYAALESLKDNFFTTTKGMDMRMINQPGSPTVVAFANVAPTLTSMTKDRFEVIHLSTK